jgi:hypothetical protein
MEAAAAAAAPLLTVLFHEDAHAESNKFIHTERGLKK